jgi:very-short-patch-repair endonuclease
MAYRSRTAPRRDGPERILERIATPQQGVLTREEALAGGLSAHQIVHRVRLGALIAVYPGVYRLGHQAPSPKADSMAAVKACGEGSAAAGLDAAFHLGLTKAPPLVPEVVSPRDRRVKGIRIHRARRTSIDIVEVDGIPVTSPAQTLVDIAGRLDDDHLARACHEAWVKHRCGWPQVARALARRPNAKGAARLRAHLLGDAPLILSRMERRFMRLLRDDGRELPTTNERVGNHRVDCHWPHLDLIIELDSYRFHGSRRAWEKDRRRDREARRLGKTLVRFTSDDVFVKHRAMLAEVRKLVPAART